MAYANHKEEVIFHKDHMTSIPMGTCDFQYGN